MRASLLERDRQVQEEDGLSNILAAFSSEQAARLAGLSKRQVEYWDTENVLHPSLRHDESGPYNRIYSFQDIVALRTLAILRERISLQKLRRIGTWLNQNYHRPWSSLRFYLAGDRIVFADPNTGNYVSTEPAGQSEFRIELEEVARDVTNRFHRAQDRASQDIGRVTRHRYIMHNAPVLAGTRIPVEVIWQFHEAGYEPDAIVREYPQLTVPDVIAAIEYENARRDQSKRRRRASA